jgi:hypothetical protein
MIVVYRPRDFIVFLADWVVDDEARKVSVRAEGRFKWIEGAGIGQWWEEEFAYIIDLDDEAKITDIQVFADTGAAYLARIGKLNALREVCLSLCTCQCFPDDDYDPRHRRRLVHRIFNGTPSLRYGINSLYPAFLTSCSRHLESL